MKKNIQLLILSIILFWQNGNSQNFPFPQHVSYTNGTIQPNNFNQNQLDDHVKTQYDNWKSTYLKSNCGANQTYVEAWANNNVSEGLGYGLMISAYMAGYDANAQNQFDELFNFFKAHPSTINSNLMAWNQNNCVSVNGPNSATDGDLDIAFGLLLADAQWGSNGSIDYFTGATNMINAIMADDINQDEWITKLGDWANPNNALHYNATRPSDFIIDHFRAFEKAVSDPNWINVVNKCYDLVDDMQTNHSSNAYLVPDFILDVNTTPVPAYPYFLEGQYDGDYYYNACRVPWRLGTDYLLNGDQRAKDALNPMTNWLKSSTGNNPSNLSNGYLLDGTKIFNWSDPAYLAPWAVSAMLDPAHQAWLNDLYSDVYNTSFGSEGYYENSIKLICMLVISGNYWQPNSTPTATPVPDPALVGYWHNWNDAQAPYIHLDQIDSRYNVVNIAFALPKAGTTYDMEFSPLQVSQATLINQIQTLQSQGKKVNISVGGATALVELNTISERDIFISSMKNIINTYGFDGIDIDLEGNSVSITGGTISNPIDAKIINLIDAIKTIMTDYYTQNGHQLMLSMAPETAFVQGGMSAYGGIWGAYLPIIDALRDSIEILHVQLYNSGSMYGIDGNIYTQGNADFIVSQTEAVLQGFNTAGGYFAPLTINQVAVGLPACPNAAGGGFVNTAEVENAIKYLFGTGSQPGSYVTVSTYPNLRGMMDWSINWDAVNSCSGTYEYAANFETIFTGGGNPNPIPPTVTITAPSNGAILQFGNVALNATASDSDGNVSSVVFDVNGTIYTASNSGGNNWNANWNVNAPGSYQIIAKATDNDNLIDSDTISITVEAPPCTEPSNYWVSNIGSASADVNWDPIYGAIQYRIRYRVKNSGDTWNASNINPPSTIANLSGLNAETEYEYQLRTECQGGWTNWTSLSFFTTPSNNVTANFVVTNDWGTGYCADITITNNNTSAVNGWTLVFNLDASITNLWNGNWSNNGNINTVSDVGWNANIPSGGSVTFGFCANYAAPLFPPNNATFNGAPIIITNSIPIPPTISITSPNDGDSFVEGSVISLIADADDSDGSIASVDFNINGSIYPATNTGGTIWEASWTANLAGSYVVTATATDDGGNTTNDIINLTITSSGGGGGSSVSGEFHVNSDWGTGYCANVKLINDGSTPINGWTLIFDLDASINNLWNGAWTNNGNNNYTVDDVGWNANIPAGGSRNFGFCASYSGALNPPYNATLNGMNINFTVTSSIIGISNNPVYPLMPGSFKIGPNITDSSTRIFFTVKEATDLKIALYDSSGRERDIIYKGRQEPGNHSLEYALSYFPPGMYFVKIFGNQLFGVERLLITH